jgi:glycosyltransferase involved in cell wall biosynthesis
MINSSGIGVYLKGCLPFFFSTPHNFLLFGDIKNLESVSSGQANVNIIHCAVKTFSFRELFFFPSPLLNIINQTDCCYSPFFNIPGGITIPVYTTIHDIIFPDMPELASKAGLWARMFFYRRAVKKSKKIFTVSNFSKSRIEYHLGTKKPVIVTYSALQPLWHEKISENKKSDYLVFVGNIKKHKGLSILLDAFLAAREAGMKHRLLIVGTKDNFRSRDAAVTEKIIGLHEDMVTFTGFITDGELKKTLAAASLLVQPSLYEGFGLPPLEAMSAGTRALISDIPVFREIYAGFPVVFFRSGDSADLKEKMLALLHTKNDDPLILPDSLLNKYTFRKTASTIMEELTN